MSERGQRRYRLAAVFHRPHPYFCKFFQRLGAQPEIDLTVYFYSDFGLRNGRDPAFQQSYQWDTDLVSGYRHVFLRNYSPRPALNRFFGLFHPGLIRQIDHRYDAVWVHGWFGLSTWVAFAAAVGRQLPLLLHSDQSDLEPPARWARPLRNRVFQWLFPRVSAFLVVGQRNAAFYRRFKVPEEKMFMTPLAVDNEFFEGERQRWQLRRADARKQLGIPTDAAVVLFVGRLAPEKGVLDLLAAVRQLSDDSLHVLVVGDGPQRQELEGYARQHGLARVHFAGFQNYSQVPRFYALADIFVLPSHVEPWALVINEAMNFNLPIVASSISGAVPDLVGHGRNGLLFEPGDVKELAGHLRTLVGNPRLRKEMGARSKERIIGWDFEQGIRGVLGALNVAVGK